MFLLFRVGLESNVRKLLENLRGATLVWIADVTPIGALDSKRGHLLFDVAELDDISGIVLMAVPFALAPCSRAVTPRCSAARSDTSR